MQEQLQLQKEFREKQEKYIYYIIALSVTAIGFSIIQTTGHPLKWLQIPLGLAVLSWSISIYCGIQFIGIMTASIFRNSMYLDLIQGKDSIAGTHPEKIQIGIDVYSKGNDKISRKSAHFYNWQARLFYLGILCFLIWHVLEMYSNQNN